MTDRTQMLQGIAAMLDGTGLSVDDLVAHLAARGTGEAGANPAYPTLGEHIDAVLANVTNKGSARTWKSHFIRLRNGTAPQCDCLCERCLDTDTGCGCDCKDCESKLSIPALVDLRLTPGAVRARRRPDLGERGQAHVDEEGHEGQPRSSGPGARPEARLRQGRGRERHHRLPAPIQVAG